MCAIAGKVSFSRRPDRSVIRSMIARMRHRGPDHQDVVDLSPREATEQGAVFGHARLSILDLSPLGHQPMTDPSGRYTVTYNGEIYNFQTLRAELAGIGCHFRSTSDTEVLLQMYIHYGVSALPRLSGMFAFAIWDDKEQELLIGRDRFGEKPLYYCFDEERRELTFASECSALLLDDTIGSRADISVAGLNHYLALGYTLSPHTIYRNIHKLAPATYLRFRDGKIVETKRYWDYARCFGERLSERPSEADAAAHLGWLLSRSVKDRLVSDVPVGAFLSGGIDSSAIVALAKRHLSYELHTFTVGFAHESYNEAEDARLVATLLQTVHHEEVLAKERSLGQLGRAIASYDEPFSDTSLIPTCAVSKVAAKHVKVVLSGDGADEIFAGYPTYQADLLARSASLVPKSARKLLAELLSKSPLAQIGEGQKTGFGFRVRQLSKGLAEDPRFAHYAWRELHGEEDRIRLIGREHAEEIRQSHPFFTFLSYYQEVGGLDWLSQHLYVDAKTWLADDILVKVDRATMAASIEARAPYLDVDLVEYVAGLPPSYKLRFGKGKYLLKKTLAAHLPLATLNKRKAGFNAPVGAWLAHLTKDNRGAPATEDEFRSFNRFVAAEKGLLVSGEFYASK